MSDIIDIIFLMLLQTSIKLKWLRKSLLLLSITSSFTFLKFPSAMILFYSRFHGTSHGSCLQHLYWLGFPFSPITQQTLCQRIFMIYDTFCLKFLIFLQYSISFVVCVYG